MNSHLVLFRFLLKTFVGFSQKGARGTQQGFQMKPKALCILWKHLVLGCKVSMDLYLSYTTLFV
jgi:hypothetical protein